MNLEKRLAIINGHAFPAVYLCTFLAILFSSSIFVAPRIFESPQPQSKARFHQHAGDGFTELGVIHAHEFWQKHGYGSTKWLPIIEPTSALPQQWIPYTHYPPGPYLLSSLALSLFGYQSTAPEAAILRTRIFYYLLTVASAAFAISLFSAAGPYPLLLGVVLGLALGGLRGFYLFADNLFGLGLVFALQGCLAALLFALCTEPKRLGLWFGIFAALSMCFSVELIPFLFLAPLLIYLSHSLTEREKHAAAKRATLAAGSAFCFVFLLRILQNSLWYGGVEGVVEDWYRIIALRVLGVSSEPAPASRTIDFVFETGVYIERMMHYQRMNLTRYGFYAMLFGVLVLFGARRIHLAKIFLAASAVLLSWNFLFLQHSFNHLYTVRYVVWCFLLMLYFLSVLGLELILHTNGEAEDLRVKAVFRL